MWKKIKILISWVLLIAYFAVSMSFVTGEADECRFNKIDIQFTDNSTHYFVDKDEILSIIQTDSAKILGSKLESVNINKIENILIKHPSILSVEVYILSNGTLKIEVQQRNPIVRIFAEDNNFYIDETGVIMPLSEEYTARVLIANGDLKISDKNIIGKNIHNFNDSTKAEYLLKKIFMISDFIYNDKLWNSQIVQVSVSDYNDFELVPLVGDQIIKFGDLDQIENKFTKLKSLYLKGFNNLGWKSYKEINLKYNNQVVCSKNENYEPVN